jgi:hypothetical protein
MKLDTAIQVNMANKIFFEDTKHPESAEAVQLGIEALKRCKEARKKAYFTTRSLLPGETEK